MATTTFSGPVKSQRGFVTAGPDAVVNITAETTLTFAAHAGKVIKVNDADGAITLPTIKADSKGGTAGDNDPNVNSHLGAVYKFFVGTDCTDCDIKTDGTDKWVTQLLLTLQTVQTIHSHQVQLTIGYQHEMVELQVEIKVAQLLLLHLKTMYI